MSQEDKPSGATLGYLAPICVAVLFVFVCIRYRLVFGTRNRSSHPGPLGDPGSWPLGVPHAVLTSNDLDARFPLTKYSTWALVHKTQRSKEAEVDSETSQAPISPSIRYLDAEEKAIGGCVAKEEADAQMECAICMECFDDDASIRALTCSHIFHTACIDPWFTKRQARCPLCKTCYPPHPDPSGGLRRPPAVILRNQIFPRVL
ncbi:hypothetical protein BJX61DRAFT_53440 [Aspergillus egyptiacus]|nr:hypothetical protein BJX61DRAFT_53440 [Aspergillus egyptiacus]